MNYQQNNFFEQNAREQNEKEKKNNYLVTTRKSIDKDIIIRV